ncbi:MAG: NUDIX domain-containing protein [Anaerococcus sp.]|nr:NUDIX domain-containing protein [Peptoniphilaceae bacterium]MDY3055530.1 NUDIX domain-containing protein [Anaerococcus sp.]
MEKWDLLDNKRNITGKFIYRGEEIPEGYYHQVIHVCIFNKNGELLIQKRHPNKNKWPSLWDLSCGGAVVFGEDSNGAASRELFEELGLSHDFSKDKFLMTITYEKGFDDYYCLLVDKMDLGKLSLQEEEVVDVAWASLSQIKNMIERGDFIPYSEELISLIFLLKDKKSYIRTK